MRLLVFLVLVKIVSSSDSFHEELLLKYLGHSKVYAYFQFTTLWDESFEHNEFNHCHLFPHSLAEVIQTYNVQELHVSLTEGLWRHRYWNYPIVDASPGAEIWTWFRKDTPDVDKQWRGLTSALSGLLCASFNFIDKINSVSPELSFRPYGVDEEEVLNSTRLRYATLPREISCTENLTPWKKLLPCDSARGLATLLNARYIHNTNYHSIGIHYRQICSNEDCSQTSIELKQTVSLVYDLVLLGGNTREWSIRKLFGIGLFNHCPLAQTSNLYVDVSNNDLILSKEPDDVVTSLKGGHISKYAVYNIAKARESSMQNLVVQLSRDAQTMSPLLHVNRFIKEYGKEFGGIITKIRNNHREPIKVIYFENIPWFVPVYYHSLRISTDTKTIVPLETRYIPGRIRARPYYLEVVFEVPGRSVAEFSIDFDYMFLKWQEYPPDANHGFYVGSAVITAALPYARNYHSLPRHVSLIRHGWNITDKDGYVVQLRTESFILGLPTPDFSMPYNVICLSCTVVALAFGPIHNITTKRLRLSKQTNKGTLRSAIYKRIRRIFGCSPADAEEQSTQCQK